MGNRLTKTDNGTTNYTYNNANMLLTAGVNNYNNDPNGNTLTGGGRTNTWDSENRLTQCSYNGHLSTYTYGSDGLRRKSVVDGETTEYALEGQNVIREMKRNTQGQLVNKATYLTGATGPVYRRDDVTGTYKWYVYDGLGSVVSEVDESGTPSAPIAFDVYGQRRYGDVGTSPNKFCGSLGHASEDETGLIYMRARYMDPTLGRFVSEDPARSGANWFGYADSNPTNKVDADGCVVAWIAAAIIGGVIGLGVYLGDTAASGKQVTWQGALKATGIGALMGIATIGLAALVGAAGFAGAATIANGSMTGVELALVTMLGFPSAIKVGGICGFAFPEKTTEAIGGHMVAIGIAMDYIDA